MKLKCYFRLLSACLLVLSTAVQSNAQGARKAMYISGTGIVTATPADTSNSYIDIGRRLTDSLAYTDFTIELWVKMGAHNSVNPAIIANKNWASGANTGLVLSYYASTDASSGTAPANTIRFNFKPAGGTRVDYDINFPAAIAQKWNHIAITVNRSGSIQGYLNGVAMGKAYTGTGSIAADAGKSLADTMPMRIGTDAKTLGYRAPFNGSLDEFRIWKTVRTADEIRNNMCHTLAGSETGLLTYYRMDETMGDTVKNSATATLGLFNGMITNKCWRVESGAPVGDSSVNFYTTTWAGKSLQMTTTNRGTFTVDSFGSTGSFLHLYKVNAAPDSTTGLTNYSDNNMAFGTFASGDSFQYYPRYNYSNYSSAVTYKRTISFFNKTFNDDPTWILKNKLYNDTAHRVMVVDSVQGTRRFFLANFVSTCDVPSALSAAGSVNSAILSWTTGGSSLWNIEYGPAGFTPGSGTKVKGVNTNPYTLSGLSSSTAYDYYVQDSCSGIGASAWTGPYAFTTTKDLSAYGGGYALHFNGNGIVGGPVQGVKIAEALHDSLSKTNFTIEMWVKIGKPNVGNPPLIADKDYVSGANTGICLTYTASALYGTTPAHYFRFNFMPQGGTRRDYDMKAVNEFGWNHLAITVDRRGFIKGYVNGVYHPSIEVSGSLSIAADSVRNLTGVLPLYLGTDGTGAYRCPFNGDMDEVRVWKKVLTDDEIRSAMCHKLAGNETDLLAYYRLDEASGTAVSNSAVATGAVMNGTTWKSPAQVTSSAPIGDSSVYIYPTSGWSGVTLSMNTLDKGMLTVDSLTDTTVPGIHMYKVNNVPNYTDGIADMGSTNKYIGVFTAENTNAAYRLQYDYATYADAVANSTKLHLYNRADNAVNFWSQLPAANNTTTHIISETSPIGVRQYLLADFITAACAAPAAVKADSVTDMSAVFTWTSSAATHFTRYAVSGGGFVSDTAAITHVNKQSLHDLTDNTTYEFYVKDSCGAGSSSAWSGPYYFTSKNGCPDPSDIHADSITMNSLVLKWTDLGSTTTSYEISWGIGGTITDPSIGILYTSTEPRYKFSGMTKNTSYDFFVRTICSGRVPNSAWIGPVTITTDSVAAPDNIIGVNAAKALRVYPNPAGDHVSVSFINGNTTPITFISIYNSLGLRVYAQEMNSALRADINTANLAAGIYYLECVLEHGDKVRQKITIQH